MDIEALEAEKTRFEDTYGPVEPTEGLFDRSDLKNVPHRNIWSVVETEQHQYVCAGLHTVNVIGYVTTAEEWESDDESYPWVLYDADGHPIA